MSSLVICYEIAYLFLAVTALEDWNIHNVDIKTIYLYGDLDKKKSTQSSLKVLSYLANKRKSGNFIKYCMALNKLAYLGSGL